MNPATWAEIVAAYEDAMRLIEAAFAAGVTGPGQPFGRVVPDLSALHARLYRRLDELRAALTPELGADGAVVALAPLLFFLDEQVQVRLAAGGGDDFPDGLKLQRYLDVVDGGDEFFVRARALLRQQPPPPPVVVGLYLFCLRAGFQGRLFDDRAAIERLEADLGACLGAPPHGAAPPASPVYRRARAAIIPFVAAAGAVVALQIVLLAIARAM